MTTNVVVEATADALWGTICINNNLIVAEALTHAELYQELKRLALAFEGMDIDYFHVVEKLD